MNGTHEDRFRWYTWIPGSHHRAMDYHSAQVFKRFIDHPLHASIAALPNDLARSNTYAQHQLGRGAPDLRLAYRHAHDIYGSGTDKSELKLHNNGTI